MNKFNKHYHWIFLLTAGLLLWSASKSLAMDIPKTTSFEIQTAYGVNLNKGNRQSALTLLPEINYRPDPRTQVTLLMVIDRPTSSQSQIEFPTVTVAGIKDLDPTGALNPNVSLAFSALSLNQLSSEGLSIRTRPALGISIQLFSFLSLSGRMGPYLLLSQSRQFASGEPKPRFGVNELIAANLIVESWKLSVELVLDQAYTNYWRNNFSSEEALEYLISKSASVGLSHSIISSVIDDTTGFYRTTQSFDERISRVSLFLNLAL
ncbi:MAG: hypothetical protein EBR01_02050 [Proteobacteria bacterium]|nr:hypothetical protein [Pseudomonadota bacterium]